MRIDLPTKLSPLPGIFLAIQDVRCGSCASA